MNARLQTLLLLALCTAMAGCTEAVDKAAKNRIFSAEDPPKAVASAKEEIKAGSAAEPEVAKRVFSIGAAEATERLGPHRYAADITFEWTNTARATKLTEKRTLFAGQGGVSGDFHALMENTRDQGLEVKRVQGVVYARNRYGKFRERKRDRGMAERSREEMFGAVRDFDEVFGGRIKLVAHGTVTHEGRSAFKYEVLAGPPRPDSTPANLPLPSFPKNGADETTRRRLRFYDKRDVKLVSGEVLVDAKTAVVLKAKLEGKLAVPADEGEANLRLTVDMQLSDIGKDPSIAAPADFLPDEDKPAGIAAALSEFGMPREGRDDAGVKAAVDKDKDEDQP